MSCLDFAEPDEYGWTLFWDCATQPEHTVLDPRECARTHECDIPNDVSEASPCLGDVVGGGGLKDRIVRDTPRSTPTTDRCYQHRSHEPDLSAHRRSYTMTITERLDDYLDEEQQFPVDKAWGVHDAGSADWALRKLAKVRIELEQVQALAAERRLAITAWEEAEVERLRPQEENWSALLAVYHRKRLADDSEVKTLRFPSGQLTARKQPDTVEIEDEDALIEWAAEKMPDAIRHKVIRSIDKSAVKQAVLKDGESIPGVSAKPGDLKFAAATFVEEVEG